MKKKYKKSTTRTRTRTRTRTTRTTCKELCKAEMEKNQQINVSYLCELTKFDTLTPKRRRRTTTKTRKTKTTTITTTKPQYDHASNSKKHMTQTKSSILKNVDKKKNKTEKKK